MDMFQILQWFTYRSYAATAQCFSLARLHAVILEPQHRTLNGTRYPRACHHCAQVRNEAASLAEAEAGVPGDIVSNHCLLTAFWFWNKEEIHQSWSIIHILVSRQVNRAHGHGQPTVPARLIYHNFTLSPLFTWCWQNQDKSVLWNLCWTEKTRSQKRKKSLCVNTAPTQSYMTKSRIKLVSGFIKLKCMNKSGTLLIIS